MKKFIVSQLIFVSVLFIACTDKRINQLYFFGETSDPKYCSKDSIVASDCSGGVIYLTEKGNAIYSFWCLGNDSTSFDIGTYQMNDSKVTCSFEKGYTYYSQVLTDTSKLNFNSGKIKRIRPWGIVLNKLNCPNFEYGFKSNIGKSHYVLAKADSEKSKIFFDDFLKIKALNNL